VAPVTNWTDEMIKLAIELWPTHSADELADAVNIRFKTSISRNGVIGKMNRLGISKGSSGRSQQRPPTARTRSPRRKNAAATVNAVPFIPRVLPRISPIVVDPSPRNVPLADIGEETCRYEVSGQRAPALYRFCNAPALPGVSYCPYHARLCFLPSDNRKRKAAA